MYRRILIIDDEADLVRFMGYRLAVADFEPLTALNGKEGLRILNEKEIDLVITDIVMPEMDGYALCKHMKSSTTLARLPIIVSTAYPEREKEFRALGVEEYMIKPIGPQKLIDTIERLLSRHAHERKHKIVLFEKDITPDVKMAISQFKDMGFKLDVEYIQDTSDIIQEVLRTKPDIFIMDAVQAQTQAPEIIRQLRGFVIIRDMAIFIYSSLPVEQKQNKKWKKKVAGDSIIKQCLDAGATRFVNPWNRETFLSVLLEYCGT